MTSHFVTLAGVRLHYLQAGAEGPTLLLLHGTALDSARLTYGAFIERLAEGRRVIALDWPGYGDSDKPPLEYSTTFYTDILKAFIDYLELAPLDIAAFSMGGAVALGFALEHPELVERLILISSYGLGGTVHAPLLPRMLLRLPFVTDLAWRTLKHSRFLLGFFLRRFVFGSARRVTPPLVDEVRKELEVEGLQAAFLTWLRREVGHLRLSTNHRRELQRLDLPVLLLHGSRDLIIPAYRSWRAAKLLPNAQLHILRGYGHWTPREAPETVLAAIENFLGSKK